MQEYADKVNNLKVSYTADIGGEESNVNDGDTVAVAGMISARKDKLTRNNTYMSYITIEDIYGTIEVLIFPKIFERVRGILDQGEPLYIKGRVDIKEDYPPKIIADSISSINEIEISKGTGKLYVKFKLGKDYLLNTILEIMARYPGNTPLCLYFEEAGKALNAEKDKYVDISSDLIKELVNILGEDCVKFVK